MDLNIEKYVKDIVDKVTKDKSILEKFKKDPVKTVTDLLGVKLDSDVINNIVTAVKGKLDLDDLKGKAGGLLGGLKNLFGK